MTYSTTTNIKARKTISVKRVLDFANNMLANSADDQVQARHAVAGMIEDVLMDTGNYKGFRFLDRDGDQSRRVYYASNLFASAPLEQIK